MAEVTIEQIKKLKELSGAGLTDAKKALVEAKGDLTVSARTDKSDFVEIDHYESITDYLVAKKKIKKFKDIQLKFSSDTRFSLEQATLECFVGGYVKK